MKSGTGSDPFVVSCGSTSNFRRRKCSSGSNRAVICAWKLARVTTTSPSERRPPGGGGARSQLPTARRRLHFERFLPRVVLAGRVRGLWLIEERLPHDPSRKWHEVWVL